MSMIKTPSGAHLSVTQWKSGQSPKAVIVILHGMSEHSARYARFADALNKGGYHVIAYDHRGHGQSTAPDTMLGMFAKSDGLSKVLSDVDALVDHAKTTHADLPVVIFGHSMGSILGLNYCLSNSNKIGAAALWNSGVDGGALLWVFKFLLGVERMFKGSDTASAIASKLTFETWNKKFAPNRTEYDWLSKDEAEVDKYVADPLCGFAATNSLWSDLLNAIKVGSDDTKLAEIRPDLPIHLLAGGKDPCSDEGKAVERIYNRMNKVGLKDVTLKVYPDNRHEALNELNRDEVTQGFIDWLNTKFS